MTSLGMISFPTITFQAPPLRVLPEEFPGRSVDFKLRSILAPLWSNIDTRRAGNVYNHLYSASSGVPGDQEILDRAAGDFEGLFVDKPLFDPTNAQSDMWVMVVTWYRVPPFEWARTSSFQV